MAEKRSGLRLVVKTRRSRELIQQLYQYMRERERAEFPMSGAEFTGLTLHQCAAGQAVNLQIDQTIGPGGSKPYLPVRALQSRKL